MAKLTARQQRFVNEYLIDLNATQAAIRAGYSKKTASSLGISNLGKASIQEAIQRSQQARAERTEITADEVVSIIHETIDRCRQVKPVRDSKGEQVYVTTPNGDRVPAFTFNAPGVLKGCELLGRHLGMFDDRLKLGVDDELGDLLKAINGRTRGIPTIDRPSNGVGPVPERLAVAAQQPALDH